MQFTKRRNVRTNVRLVSIKKMKNSRNDIYGIRQISLRRFCRQCLSIWTLILRDTGYNLRVLRPAPFNVARLRRCDICSMTDSPGGRLRLFVVSILLYFHLFCPSPTMTCGTNASTKGSQPFGDATCDESARKRVFRFGTNDEVARKKKRAMKMWGKISRVRHPVLLSRWFWWIRGENSCRFSARLARREDVGIFHRDADISQIYNGNSDALFFVNAKQYCGQCTYRVTWVTFCNDSVWSTVCRRLLESRIKDRDTIMSRCTIKIYSNKYTQKDIPFFCDILLISEDFPLIHGFKKIFKMQRKIIQS